LLDFSVLKHLLDADLWSPVLLDDLPKHAHLIDSLLFKKTYSYISTQIIERLKITND
jgi:hypothetical protein